jgi:glycosyltransferase involved in cell wall biosynthesis
MSVKEYGIYLAFAPTVDLRHEGLGRYFAALLKGASDRDDLRFVLVCPSWSRDGLEKLFASEGVPKECFQICSPAGKPYILQGFEAYEATRKKTKGVSFCQRSVSWVRKALKKIIDIVIYQIVQAHSFITFIPVLISLGILAAVLFIKPSVLIFILVLLLINLIYRVLDRAIRPLLSLLLSNQGVKKLIAPHVRSLYNPLIVWGKNLKQLVRFEPKNDNVVLRFYHVMEKCESKRMLRLINSMPNVLAWYSPSAFWPAFNQIKTPRLMCVPDVVLADFPVGFSGFGERIASNFRMVESAIRTGQYFVTYSEVVKWETLVDRYHIHARNVTVIPHAPNSLSRWVELKGSDNTVSVSGDYCQQLLLSAFKKTTNPDYLNKFSNTSVKFLFYASQIRPNKNLISLLRAYEYLLRRKLIGHKLILTGYFAAVDSVREFIAEHFLENDVLSLHGLTIQELAACYKLADLAVNPSLSEGGCPFTFTEALSVNTPVVMARIPVAEEVLTDPQLQEMTFFDPYNWLDMAQRIEWALNNREQLLSVQKKCYEDLARRTWKDVANEHIEILDRISNVELTKPDNSH